MPTEVDYQRALIEQTIDEGGHGRKLANRFVVGIPDLLLAHPRYRTSLIEVKLVELPKHMDTKVNIPITPKQRDELRRWQAGGSSAGWVAIHQIKPGEVLVLASRELNYHPTHEEFLKCAMLKTRRQGWGPPLHYCLQTICGFRSEGSSLTLVTPSSIDAATMPILPTTPASGMIAK